MYMYTTPTTKDPVLIKNKIVAVCYYDWLVFDLQFSVSLHRSSYPIRFL